MKYLISYSPASEIIIFMSLNFSYNYSKSLIKPVPAECRLSGTPSVQLTFYTLTLAINEKENLGCFILFENISKKSHFAAFLQAKLNQFGIWTFGRMKTENETFLSGFSTYMELIA